MVDKEFKKVLKRTHSRSCEMGEYKENHEWNETVADLRVGGQATRDARHGPQGEGHQVHGRAQGWHRQAHPDRDHDALAEQDGSPAGAPARGHRPAPRAHRERGSRALPALRPPRPRGWARAAHRPAGAPARAGRVALPWSDDQLGNPGWSSRPTSNNK